MRRAWVPAVALVAIVFLLLWAAFRGEPRATATSSVAAGTAAAHDASRGADAGRDDPRDRPRVRAAPPDVPTASGQTPAVVAPPERGIRGVVRRADTQAPIGGATVRWFLRDAPDAARGDDDASVVARDAAERPADGRVATGADGVFEIDVPPGTACRVVAATPGWGAASADATAPAALTIDLAAARAVVLRFVDAQSRDPVPGVTARVVAGEADGPVVATFRGDDDGRATRLVAPGTRLLVVADAYVARWVDVDPPSVSEEESEGEGDAEVEVALRRAARIAGQVVDASGGAVSGARVRLNDALDGEVAWLAAETEHDGRFAFDVPPDGGPDPYGAHALRVAADGFGPAEVACFAGETDVRVVLERAAWIEGRVVDEAGRTVEDFEIDGGRNVGGGRFEMGPVAPGAVAISVDRRPASHVWGGYGYGRDFAVVAAGERRTGVVVTMYAAGDRSLLRGRIVDPDGRAVAHAVLVVVDPGRGRVVARPGTDQRGVAAVARSEPPGTVFLLSAVPPGQAESGAALWVQGPAVRAATAARDAADAADAEPVDVPLAVGRALALQFVEEDGAEIDRRRVQVAGSGEGFRVVDGGVVAARGASVVLELDVDGQQLVVGPVAADRAVDGVLTVQVPRGVTVRGVVVFPEDVPRAPLRAALRVAPSDGSRAVHGSAPVADDGTFTLRRVPARGDAVLDLKEGDARRLRRTFVLAGEDVDLGDVVLPERVPIRGVVVDDRGRPVAYARVWFSAPPDVGASARCGRDGTFTLLVPDGVPGEVSAGRSPLLSRPVPAVAARDAAPLTLHVLREAHVIVRASFAGGGGSGVRVTYRSVDGGPVQWASYGNAGTPVLHAAVPAGTWNVRVAHGGRTWERRVTLAPGAAVEWTLDE